jgi:cytochrome P450
MRIVSMTLRISGRAVRRFANDDRGTLICVSETIPGTSLLDPGILAAPYSFYERLRTEAPVWEIPSTGIFTVASFELLTEAASRVEDFSSNLKCLLYRDNEGLPRRFSFGDAGVQALATVDPPMHALHRSTVFPELVAKRMATLEPDIVEIAETCVHEALGHDSVDFMATVGNLVPIAMINRLIGFHDSDLDQLLSAAFESTAVLDGVLTEGELMALLGRTGEIHGWVGEQLASAMSDPADDLLGAVARGVESGAFTEFEGVVILHVMLSAGGESTASLLGNAVRLLAEHQDVQDHLRQRPGLIPQFIEEALRLEPPFRNHMRFVPKATTLGGVEIPAEATLLLLWGAANRDAATFSHPADIDLTREVPRRHVAFGRGIHHCVGAPLARVEAKTVLNVLLASTSDISLDPERPPVWRNSLMVRRHEELAVRLQAI